MRSENKNRKILPEVIQELFCVWRLQQSLTWRTLPQLSDFFQTWTGTVQTVVGGGDMEGEQRLSTGWCCFWLAAAIDDKCPTDHIQTQPQYIFKLYIREKPFVHQKQKHNPPPPPHCGCGPEHPPPRQAGQLGSYSCILTQRGFVHWAVGTDGKAGKAGKTRTIQAAASPPLNVLESCGSLDKSPWFNTE